MDSSKMGPVRVVTSTGTVQARQPEGLPYERDYMPAGSLTPEALSVIAGEIRALLPKCRAEMQTAIRG